MDAKIVLTVFAQAVWTVSSSKMVSATNATISKMGAIAAKMPTLVSLMAVIKMQGTCINPYPIDASAWVNKVSSGIKKN